MKLSDDTYYGKEANQAFFSVSQYKDFCKCEAMAMAKIRGEFEQKQTKAMLIGTLVDRWFEGTLDKLREESPYIFYCRNGALRADFRKADEIIKRLQRDERFMQYMSGEKQKILTFEMFNMLWKMKMDSFVEGVCISDLKIVTSIDEDSESVKRSFRRLKYHIQGAVYQAGAEANGYGRLPFYLAIATKEKTTNFNIYQICQPEIDAAITELEQNMPHFIRVKQGIEPPEFCGNCDYCRLHKRAEIRNYVNLIQ